VPDDPSDALQLQTEFVCTDPPKKRYQAGLGKVHPREWELDAQSALRDTKFPCEGSLHFRVAKLADHQIVAAAKFDLVMSTDVDGRADGWIFSAAVARGWQGQGLGLQLIRAVENDMIHHARALGAVDLWMACKVHKRNEACQRLLAGAGWELYDGGSGDGSEMTGDHYDRWAVSIDLKTS
jgi:GNAT superfamily N-acetyltransferase